MNIYNSVPTSPIQPNNPTDEQRYALMRYALLQKGRPEDFEYIRSLTAPPQDITTIVKPGELRGIRIGIIGAGLAGLASAYELRKIGAEITIFEADGNRIGGRVYTYYFDESKRLYGELGTMRIPVSHETVWHYIKLFNLQTRPFIQTNENTFIYLRNIRVRNDSEGKNVMRYIYPKYSLSDWERQTPWQQLVYYGLESPLLNANPNQRSELLQVKPYYNSFINYWDFQSNRKIMETLGLSQDAINLISSLSPLAGQNLYNSYIDIAQANYPANLSYLYEISGGNSILPYALYNSLINPRPIKDYPFISCQQLGKINVKLGSPVTGIYKELSTGKVILEYSSNASDNPRYDNFDYVICAIPFSTLRTVEIKPLFSSIKMQAIREVNYIASQKTLMLCNRRFWEEGGPNEQIIGGGSYTDLPITSIWYPSDHAGYYQNSLPKELGVLMASYNYSLDAVRLANLTSKIRLKEIKKEVEEVHGLPRGYLDPIVLDHKTIDWNSNTWSRGALTFFTPEQKRLFSYGMTLPEYDNRVFMAGDHISAVHRWMQGALHSGMTSANRLALAFKKILSHG